MNIWIAGGSGLIGRALCEELVTAGHAVTVLTRSPERARALLPPAVDLQPWDGVSLGEWAGHMAIADAVVNLAGESIAGGNFLAILTRRWSPQMKARIRGSRQRVGALLTEAIRQAERKPTVLVQASAVGYYGARQREILREDASPGSDFLAQVCRDWEASTLAVEAMGVRRVVIRTGLVLTRRGGILPLMLLPVRLFVGGPLGSGEQMVSWVHIVDEVAAIRHLLEHKTASGAYNLTAPQPVTYREFVRVAGRVLHRPTVFPPVLGVVLRLVLGEKATLVLDGQHAAANRLLEVGYRFRFETLEAALRDLTN